jgi:predicted nucleic acid-binding protein
VTLVAFLDASVLYPSTIRSVLMFLAAFDAFRAQWSEDVHREWMAALARNRPDLDAKRIARTRALMEAHLPNAMVVGYQRRIAKLVLPDPDDRHVLAAALHGRAHVIVTSNLKHFPKAVLKSHGMTAQHPDAFVCDLIAADLDRAVRAFAADRARMANPQKSVEEYLVGIEAVGLKKSAEMLRQAINHL